MFAVPGDLATPTGGYAYDRRIIAELPALGWQVDVLDLGDGFPRPTRARDAPPRMRSSRRCRRRAPDRDRRAGVRRAARTRPRRCARAIRWSRWCTIRWRWRSGLTRGRGRGVARERARGAGACAPRHRHQRDRPRGCSATDYGVAADRITVVRAGHRPRRRPRARAAAASSRCCRSAPIVPRKGYDVLVAALAQLADLPWRLIIAGDRTPRSGDRARSSSAEIARLRLGRARRRARRGVARAARAALRAADLFVLASRFEGYGMAYAEAIAHGLPVIGTTAGAIPRNGAAGAGLLVPPDDVDALARRAARG